LSRRDTSTQYAIHHFFLLLKAFSYGHYGLVLCSNLNENLCSLFIFLILFDSDDSIDSNINILHLICCFASLSMQCLLMVVMSVKKC
jgi:hypothetical protein